MSAPSMSIPMIGRILDGTLVECSVGDIASQPDLDAVVNAANAQFRIGGGVAGALHRAAGPGLEAECQSLAPVKPGQAVISGAHALPNHWVIHVLGPVYGTDEPGHRLLADCYRNALRLADQHAIESIGFPSVATGAFGYPMAQAAAIAMRTIAEDIPSLRVVKLIRFVLYDRRAFTIHMRALEAFPFRVRSKSDRSTPAEGVRSGTLRSAAGNAH